MGVYGKQQNAPGYQKVAAERERLREVKEKHLTYTWFVEELEKIQYTKSNIGPTT